MIARLHVLIPFTLSVPTTEEFAVHPYSDGGCEVRLYPPVRDELPPLPEAPDEIEINGAPAFHSRTLRIDFHRESFERRKESESDPSYPLMRRAINSFLIKLRYVVQAAWIGAVD